MDSRSFVLGGVTALVIVGLGHSVSHEKVAGNSMTLAFRGGDHLLVDTLSYRFREPARSEVVALLYPLNPDKSFIERIVAVEGDTVRIIDGRVYVNDQPLADPYVSAEFRSHDHWGPQVVPEGYYFVLGDRRNGSSDSRHWGTVPRKYVWGRVLATMWHGR